MPCTDGVGCSQSPPLVVPMLGLDSNYYPIYQTVTCCGVPRQTMVDIQSGCYVVEMKRPYVQEHLSQLNARARLYVPACDGWFRPFVPMINMSRKTQAKKGSVDEDSISPLFYLRPLPLVSTERHLPGCTCGMEGEVRNK